MRTTTTAALAALMTLSAASTSFTTSAEARYGRGAAIATGVAIGLTAAAIASSRARATYYDDGYGWRRRCESWAWRCDHGSDYACMKYQRYC